MFSLELKYILTQVYTINTNYCKLNKKPNGTTSTNICLVWKVGKLRINLLSENSLMKIISHLVNLENTVQSNQLLKSEEEKE